MSENVEPVNPRESSAEGDRKGTEASHLRERQPPCRKQESTE